MKVEQWLSRYGYTSELHSFQEIQANKTKCQMARCTTTWCPGTIKKKIAVNLNEARRRRRDELLAEYACRYCNREVKWVKPKV